MNIEEELNEANQRIQRAYEILKSGDTRLKTSEIGDLLVWTAAQQVDAARGMEARIKYLEAKLVKCADIMECNDPGNYQLLFR